MNSNNKEDTSQEAIVVPTEVQEHVHGPNCNHGHHHHHIDLKPIMRDSSKIGRNDPCSCGSQKKYKKCCGLITVNF